MHLVLSCPTHLPGAWDACSTSHHPILGLPTTQRPCWELPTTQDLPQAPKAARKVKDNAGVYVVPAFTGLGAPHWDMYARGAILGLTRGAGRNHIIRAALESIAYQSGDVIRAMEEDTHD